MRDWRVRYIVDLVLLFFAAIQTATAQEGNVVCRIEDPNRVTDCNILRQCSQRVYPVDLIQGDNLELVNRCGGGLNNMVSLFAGNSTCTYFSNLIGTTQGRNALADIVQQELQKSSFRGIDLQCDPTVRGTNQTAYNGCLRLLRQRIGFGFFFSVRIENPDLDPVVIDTLNELIDLIHCSQDGNGSSSIVDALIRKGCNSRKIVVNVELPSVVTCPISGVQLQNAADSVKDRKLFGAAVLLDNDDIEDRCGNGSFPQLRKLSNLFAGANECEFDGFIPDLRNRSRFYSCSEGRLNLHECPFGQMFDRINSTCIPFAIIDCNETTCLVRSPVPIRNDTQLIPIGVPFPRGFTPIPDITVPPPTPPPTAAPATTPAPTTTIETSTTTTVSTTASTTQQTTSTVPTTLAPVTTTLPPGLLLTLLPMLAGLLSTTSTTPPPITTPMVIPTISVSFPTFPGDTEPTTTVTQPTSAGGNMSSTSETSTTLTTDTTPSTVSDTSPTEPEEEIDEVQEVTEENPSTAMTEEEYGGDAKPPGSYEYGGQQQHGGSEEYGYKRGSYEDGYKGDSYDQGYGSKSKEHY
ncbi:uncharacterized protein LOC129743427 [Uranotaenia lowii]|uniref:uncharacterized protein LOC129743427 n=1 Tax=Uranotaenia lowii TaxID=190385 RepID=UPI0024789770|nr:uncharacterized protein LOC129743427 [Uranotaenia lowii]